MYRLQEKELAQRRHEHQALMAKGSDYLVEVELGHAPPLQFIMANMRGAPQDPRNSQGAKVHGDHDSSSDEGDDASDDDVPLQQLFDEIEHAMPATRRRIEMLRHGLEARNCHGYCVPYAVYFLRRFV